MNKEIKTRIKKVLINKMLQGFKPEDIGDNTPLIEFGVGVDSVATLELIVALEEEFHINIDESEINQEFISTINAISEYVSKRMESAS
ncbi:MAG: acyl carrier protein [Candidatus Dadabacteria bacterium]